MLIYEYKYDGCECEGLPCAATPCKCAKLTSYWPFIWPRAEKDSRKNRIINNHLKLYSLLIVWQLFAPDNTVTV